MLESSIYAYRIWPKPGLDKNSCIAWMAGELMLFKAFVANTIRPISKLRLSFQMQALFDQCCLSAPVSQAATSCLFDAEEARMGLVVIGVVFLKGRGNLHLGSTFPSLIELS